MPEGRRWPRVARRPAAQRGPRSPGVAFQRTSPQRPRQVAFHPPPRQPPPAACWYNRWYNASRGRLQLVYSLDLELRARCFPSWMSRVRVPSPASSRPQCPPWPLRAEESKGSPSRRAVVATPAFPGSAKTGWMCSRLPMGRCHRSPSNGTSWSRLIRRRTGRNCFMVCGTTPALR